MLKILKLLFLISGLSSGANIVINQDVINAFNGDFIIQENHLQKSPFYLIKSLNYKDASINVDQRVDSEVYTSSIEKFISLKELQLEDMEDYWFDSDLKLDFTNIVERDSRGNKKTSVSTNPNLSKETFGFSIKLDKRQAYKEIEKEYSYHDEWNDIFIFTKLNLKFEKQYINENKGIKISGEIIEEVLIDKNILVKNSNNRRLGQILYGGLIIKNVESNFSSRKNAFKDSEPKDYIHKMKTKNNYSITKERLAVELKNDESFFSHVGVENNSSYNVSVNYLYNDNYFTNDKYIGSVDIYDGTKLVLGNIKVIFEGKGFNGEDDYINLQYESRLENLEENHKKIIYFISERYKIDKSKLHFDKNDLENSNAIKNFNSKKNCIFKYIFKKPLGGVLIFKVYISHTYQKSSEYVTMSNWNEIAFSTTNKNYQVDNLRILNQGSILGDDLIYKEIKTSLDNIVLRKETSEDLFIFNYKKFRNIKITSSNNIQVINEGSGVLKIKALDMGGGFLELDSIDAVYKKCINIEVLRDLGSFDLEDTLIKTKRGNDAFVKIFSENYSDIFVVNRNPNVKAKIIKNNLWVNSSEVGTFEIIVMSDLTKQEVRVKIIVEENFAEVLLNKDVSIIENEKIGFVELTNFESLESNEIKLSSNSENLMFSRNKERISFSSVYSGEYILNIEYRNFVTKIKIFVVNEIFKTELEIFEDFMEIDKSSHEIKNYDSNIILEEMQNGYRFILLDPQKDGYIEVLRNTGEYLIVKINSKKEVENNEEKTENKNMYDLSKVLPLILIPITLGVSLFVFFILKKTYKKGENKNKTIN
ncbi:hypothetical protein [Spiroplasma monobiae]|uniref:Uncharacterized protein n=1 Tax=Spiroplasma monobiae MQ-1 TaxID=1336748 RepID=A0A2K9LV50_SPISQ|nr:hypothetical protein [Spiroplasma monobiae]AUM62912.1 hypothetical protein SMONO_v1c06630 [Spiroplasma monobiae MQ-1]